MRMVELATSATVMALSLVFMIYATALPIGWIEGAGPGGGMFPFWLSLAMFLCAGAIFVKQWRASTDPRLLRRVFIHPSASGHMAITAGATVVTVALLPALGAYIVLPAFLVGYARVVGRSSWRLAVSLAVGTALFLFFFFEVALKILLPKGVTEPLFIPLYAIFF
jgi:TRAP-type C4-dicarboxylate transport system permease small subunit